MILPLATRRDKVTQVRWGLEDFRARFGREPEGMWLPETAVDNETLEVLAEAGVKFTILAPHQAGACAPIGTEAWEEVGDGSIRAGPTSGAAPRGRTLALFFYDGPISRAIAFEDAAGRRREPRGPPASARSRRRATGRSSSTAPPTASPTATTSRSATWRWPPRSRADRGRGLAALTNYGAFLAAHPPTTRSRSASDLLELRPRRRALAAPTAAAAPAATGTSAGAPRCARRSTGCATRSTPSTRRAPRPPQGPVGGPRRLRRASSSTAAPERLDAFLGRAQRAPLDAAARVETRRLLEMQRNRLLMYTSCGWFFDEISGLEPVQILKYAAMALQYLRDLGGGHWKPSSSGGWRRPQQRARASRRRRGLPPPGPAGRRRPAPGGRALRDQRVVRGVPDDAPVYAYRVQRLDEAREAYAGHPAARRPRPRRLRGDRREPRGDVRGAALRRPRLLVRHPDLGGRRGPTTR